MFKQRVITALIGVPLITVLMYAGDVYSRVFFVLLAWLSITEFYRMMRDSKQQPLYLAGYLLALILILPDYWGDYYHLLLLLVLLLAVGQLIIAYPQINITDMGLSLFFAGYVAWLLSYAVKILMFPDGFALIMFCFAVTWCNDIGGYMAGKKWGRRRIVPQLSPKKSWEGFIGALMAAVLAAFVFDYLVDSQIWSWYYAVLVGTLACIAAHAGDLLASAAKRYYNVKDSGSLLPGHGGFLDRFDSFFLVAPVIYYLLK